MQFRGLLAVAKKHGDDIFIRFKQFQSVYAGQRSDSGEAALGEAALGEAYKSDPPINPGPSKSKDGFDMI